MSAPISMIAAKIAELCHVLKAGPASQYPGAWIHDVDEHWKVAVNGHRHSVEVPSTDACMGVEDLQPFEFAVFFNGWLAGIFNSFGGTMVAGSEANEDALIDALEVAIGKVQAA